MSSRRETSAWERVGLRRLPLSARLAIGVAAAIVAVNLAARALESSVGGSAPAGRRGSAYAAAPNGLAAFVELLHRNGRDVERRRGSLTQGRLDPHATMFVIEPDALPSDEAAELAHFVEAGGRLVIAGGLPGSYLADLGVDPPSWSFEAPRTWTSVDSSLAPIAEVEASGNGAWVALGESRQLVGTSEGGAVLLALAQAGRGEILYLADATPLENLGLANADNAALAIALAGDVARPVVFAEGVHGFGASSGWRAMPEAWKLALGGLTAAALVLMWARGHRLGPPERASRPLAPPRRDHVVALASTLARTRSFADTAAPVQAAVRHRLEARGGLVVGAPCEDLDRAGIAAGLHEEERRASLGSVDTVEDLIAVGRALARLSVHDGGERR